jgi:hypothetical protein
MCSAAGPQTRGETRGKATTLVARPGNLIRRLRLRLRPLHRPAPMLQRPDRGQQARVQGQERPNEKPVSINGFTGVAISQSAARLNSRSNQRKAPAFPELLRWLCPRSPSVSCRLLPLTQKPRRVVFTNQRPYTRRLQSLGKVVAGGMARWMRPIPVGTWLIKAIATGETASPNSETCRLGVNEVSALQSFRAGGACPPVWYRSHRSLRRSPFPCHPPWHWP